MFHEANTFHARETAKQYKQTAIEHEERGEEHLKAAQQYLETGNRDEAEREATPASEAFREAEAWIMKAKIEQDTISDLLAKAKGDAPRGDSEKPKPN